MPAKASTQNAEAVLPRSMFRTLVQTNAMAGDRRSLRDVGADRAVATSRDESVAVAECDGSEAGVASLDALTPPAWLAGSYLWDAVLADLHRRAGNPDSAEQHGQRAVAPRSDGDVKQTTC